MYITENFTWVEFTRSFTAVKLGLNNRIPRNGRSIVIRRNIKNLCENILQPARNQLGMPIHISSGFRTASVNSAVGGAKNSFHLYGRAADIYPHDIEKMPELFTILKSLPCKELIYYEQENFIHVAY